MAGLALALSFASLALIDLRQFREFAFAMSVGVLLDAFVIRALLIPALISLFGDLSWWPRKRRPGRPPPKRPRNAERALSGALWTKEFAKPVALSSVHPADFPLAGTATRINFDLVTLRAWRSTNVSGLDGSHKSPPNKTCRYLQQRDLGPKKIRRAGHAFVHSSG